MKVNFALDKLASCVLGSMTSMARVTLEEKRLKQLKQQLFGKELPIAREVVTTKSQRINTFQIQSPEQNQKTIAIDPISLKTDFAKIVSFSVIALGIQLFLFFANKQGLVKLF